MNQLDLGDLSLNSSLANSSLNSSLNSRRRSSLPPVDKFNSLSRTNSLRNDSIASINSISSINSNQSLNSISSTRTSHRFPSIPINGVDPNLLVKLNRYLLGFTLIEFDQDKGADLDVIYPQLNFSKQVEQNIAFCSLPEGDLPTSGGHTYSWRIKLSLKEMNELNSSFSNDESSSYSNSSNNNNDDDEFLHGFVYFHQDKSEKLRRGSLQRSLVLLTRKPSLVGLFSTIISILGPIYFKDCRGETIQAACSEIACWPDMVEGTTLELPFFGNIYSVTIPLGTQPQWPISQRGSVSSLSIPASIPLTPLSVHLHGGILSFTKILLLFELILLGENVLVCSRDPRSGSELVHHLRNFIRPLEMKGDYRPYLQIHDDDFSTLVDLKKPPPPGSLISSTNPLILSRCLKNSTNSWTNIIKIGNNGGKSGGLGLISTKKRLIRRDKFVEKEVEKAFAKGDYLRCDELIFQHLATLTEKFLAPLNRYFGTLFLLDNTLNAPSESPTFLPIQFLSSLSSHGTPLLFRSSSNSTLPSSSSSSNLYSNSSPTSSNPTNISTSNPNSNPIIQKFYTAFLNSPNFKPWFQSRLNLINQSREKNYLKRLEEVNLSEWINTQGRRDSEVNGLMGRLEIESRRAAEGSGSGGISFSTGMFDGSSGSNGSTRSGGTGTGGTGEERVKKLKVQASRLRILRNERDESNSFLNSSGGSSGSESDVGSMN